eukprot:NODE_6537_length_525_cov_10.816583_g6372_i0.p1 GENE.NODE_6537_length_525_cov_10.816583_g6372_i0~~NODE_6537_length_525_cov_10.816583_g6372_i0.p1  ORF type:complete len:150 (-),score=9.61 NODE_6537_length_525_cov_10.816583_g6372_i0:27-476(-)
MAALPLNTFWGLTVGQEGARLPPIPHGHALYLTHACLDLKASTDSTSLSLRTGPSPAVVVCTLRPEVENIPLNLCFTDGPQVRLCAVGPNIIHLSGYYHRVDVEADPTPSLMPTFGTMDDDSSEDDDFDPDNYDDQSESVSPPPHSLPC